MNNIVAIAWKELKAYFASPVAYVVTAFFLVINGYLFSLILIGSREATLRYLFQNAAFVLVLTAPILTMRLLAEEQRMGTIELLLTAPIRDWEMVVGKFTGAMALYTVMLALTLIYPVILFSLGGNPDRAPIATGYLAMWLMGGGFLAAGLFFSALTQNQVVAAFLSFVFLLILWVIDAMRQVVTGLLADIFGYLASYGHFAELLKGVVDTKDLIYFVSVIVAFLFLTTRVVETRRWA